MSANWRLRMEHERAWRDSGVESGCRRPPADQDEPGSLALAGPLRKSTPELDRLFRNKGHNSLRFDACSCNKRMTGHE